MEDETSSVISDASGAASISVDFSDTISEVSTSLSENKVQETADVANLNDFIDQIETEKPQANENESNITSYMNEEYIRIKKECFKFIRKSEKGKNCQ